MTTVTEVALPGPLPLYTHPGWKDAFPWLAQGISGRGDPDVPFNLGLFTQDASRAVQRRWGLLLEAVGFDRVAIGRQVHGGAVVVRADAPPGMLLGPACDGHVTRQRGLLLAVAVADCVPVTVVHPESRTVALLHAGWRGVAAGILEGGLAMLRDRLDVDPAQLHVHLGPSASGERYEVGPEVFQALGASPPRDGRGLIDLRDVLARRASGLGVEEGRLTVSAHCTMDPGSPFFSHRRGHGGRQVAYLGIRHEVGGWE